jgi:uncharacterized protein YjeT (DUF2065 family)
VNIRRALGILIIIGGIVLFGISQYIKGQVEEGKMKISNAEKKIEQGNKLFSFNPISKQVGQQITGSAQKKINEGKEEVDYYTQLANQLQIGGYILMIVGLVIVLIPKKTKRRK